MPYEPPVLIFLIQWPMIYDEPPPGQFPLMFNRFPPL